MAARAMTPPARAQAVDRSVARLFEAFDRVPVAAVIRHAEDLPRALASRDAPRRARGPGQRRGAAGGPLPPGRRPDPGPPPSADHRRWIRNRAAPAGGRARARGTRGQHQHGEPVAVRTPGLYGAMLPAIRDSNTLHQALDLGYRQLLVERGSLLAMVGPLAGAARQGVAIFVNPDAVEGLGADSAALAFLATHLGFSGVVSVKPHLLRDASRFRLRTIQRIHR